MDEELLWQLDDDPNPGRCPNDDAFGQPAGLPTSADCFVEDEEELEGVREDEQE